MASDKRYKDFFCKSFLIIYFKKVFNKDIFIIKNKRHFLAYIGNFIIYHYFSVNNNFSNNIIDSNIILGIIK